LLTNRFKSILDSSSIGFDSAKFLIPSWAFDLDRLGLCTTNRMLIGARRRWRRSGGPAQSGLRIFWDRHAAVVPI